MENQYWEWESCIYHCIEVLDCFSQKSWKICSVYYLMPQLLIIQFLLFFLDRITSVQVGSINGVFFASSSATIVSMNGSCAVCICSMLLSNNIIGLSCLQNETCLFFHNYSSFYTLTGSPNSSFYFLILPPEQQYSTYETTEEIQMSEL
jgi:hypothetical protein